MQVACLCCRLLEHPLEADRLTEIITEAVDIEKEFLIDALPVSCPFWMCPWCQA